MADDVVNTCTSSVLIDEKLSEADRKLSTLYNKKSKYFKDMTKGLQGTACRFRAYRQRQRTYKIQT